MGWLALPTRTLTGKLVSWLVLQPCLLRSSLFNAHLYLLDFQCSVVLELCYERSAHARTCVFPWSLLDSLTSTACLAHPAIPLGRCYSDTPESPGTSLWCGSAK